MKCPHCLIEFHDREQQFIIGTDCDGGWSISKMVCPACKRFIVALLKGEVGAASAPNQPKISQPLERILIRPKGALRPRPSPDVPKDLADDFMEACLILADSPKASAALSRRCLQHLLREAAKVKPGDLFQEIQEVLDRGKLPSHIADSIDAVRNIGNFAAHPIKSKSSGEVVPVEPGEAEWNLDVLEALFDFYFVQPAVLKKKREALNKKLDDAGKKPMK